MAKQKDETGKENVMVGRRLPFPGCWSLKQVQEILNLGMPSIYALVKSEKLRTGQFGGRNVWRVSEADLAAYIDAVYAKTAANIASGQILDSDIAGDS